MIDLILTATLMSMAPTDAAAAGDPAPRSSRRICRTVERPASRMGGVRICKTEAEWNEEREAARQFTADRQNRNLENSQHMSVSTAQGSPAPQ